MICPFGFSQSRGHSMPIAAMPSRETLSVASAARPDKYLALLSFFDERAAKMAQAPPVCAPS